MRRRRLLLATAIAAVGVPALAATALAAATTGTRSAGGVAAAGRLEHAGAVEQAGPDPAAGSLRMDLIDQAFAFSPNDDVHLVYRLSGDLGAVAELEPAPTTSTTTTSTTTTSTTTPTGAEGTDGAPAPDAPAPVELTIVVTNYAPLVAADRVEPLVGSDVSPDAFHDAIDGLLVTDLRRRARFGDDGSVTFSLDLPTDVDVSQPDRMKFDRPGLYPLRVQLVVGPRDQPTLVVSTGTIVQRLPGATAATRPLEPIDLALVANVDDPGPLADAAEREEAGRRLEAVAGTAAALADPFTLALPPSVVTAATATRSDQANLSEQLAEDELVALPDVPFDVSSAVAADQLDAFTRELRAGEDMLTEALPTIPNRRDVWLATEPLSASGAQALRDLGTRLVVMTDDVYRATIGPILPDVDQFVEIALPDGGTLPLLVVDPLGAQLTPEATTGVLAERTAAEWAVATIARLLLDQDAGSATIQRSRAIATPDMSAPDPRLLQGLERIAATAPGIRFSAGSALMGVTDVQRVGIDPVRVELPEVAGPSIDERVRELNGTRLIMANAASMIAPDDPRPVRWNADLDALVATGYPDEHVTQAIADMRAEAEELLGSIVAPEPFTFTLTGKSGDIEMRIGNVSDEPLNVKLRMSSPKLTFPRGDQIVSLRPRDETTVVVPVRARANGTSLVTVEILTPVDQPLADPVMVTSRVQSLTGLGQVLTGGLILVLLTWWFTHWRTRRRAAGKGAPTGAADPPGLPAAGE